MMVNYGHGNVGDEPDPLHEEATEVIDRLLHERLMVLAALYPEAPRFVATICDTRLDPSGALLGEVRALVDAALGGKQ